MTRILVFPVAIDMTASVVFSGHEAITRAAVKKLIEFLKVTLEAYPNPAPTAEPAGGVGGE